MLLQKDRQDQGKLLGEAPREHSSIVEERGHSELMSLLSSHAPNIHTFILAYSLSTFWVLRVGRLLGKPVVGKLVPVKSPGVRWGRGA